METWLPILPASAVALLALLYFSRREFVTSRTSIRAGALWTIAWVTLLFAGMFHGRGGDSGLALAASRAFGAVFPFLLVGGAHAFADRAIPRWLAPATVAWTIASVGAALALAPSASNVLEGVVEGAVTGWAAWIVWDKALRPRRQPVEVALAVLLGAAALFDALDGPLRSRYPDLPLVDAWLVLSLATAFTSVLAFADRSRRREEALRDGRRMLREVLGVLADPIGPRAALSRVAGVLRGFEPLQSFGIWLYSESDDLFELVEEAGERPVPEHMRRSPSSGPGVRATLDHVGPVFFDDVSGDPRLEPETRRTGLRFAFSAALRANGKVVGMIGGALRRALDQDARAFVADLSEQIALIVASLRTREMQDRQAELLDAERRMLLATIEAVPAGILLTDPAGRVDLMSVRMAEMLGVAEPAQWSGRLARDVLDSVRERLGVLERIQVEKFVDQFAADRTRPLDRFEIRFQAPNERIVVLTAHAVRSTDGRHLGRVWAARDVTRERQLAERIQLADRMQTVGTLAGGLAHDFNNQLTAILGNARLLLEELGPADASRPTLMDLIHGAEHCAELTQGLLAFARQGRSARDAVDLGEALAEVEGLVRPTLGADARLEVRIEPGTPPVLADPLQLRRVLTNLVSNAGHAVGRRGRVEVAAKASGESVLIEVRDDGMGMDEETRRRIFDPFFTTKETGHGTGLGLAIVYGIVDAHGGTIEVESAPTRGSTFRLRWPAAPAREEVGEDARQGPPQAHRHIDATVLLAEDEPSVRRLARTVLERAGYRVVEAQDGAEAASVFEAKRGEIRMALLDLSMPRLDGLEALAAMRTLRPGLPAVVMSGHPDRDRSLAWPGDVALLPKPFSPAALLEAVATACGDAARVEAGAASA